jgi:phosphate:Na+ symporter
MFQKIARYALIICAVFICASAASAADNNLVMVSGDNQTGIRGYPLKNNFSVRVTGENGAPVENARVDFAVIASGTLTPAHTLANGTMSPATVYTGADGTANAQFNLAKNTSDEIVIIASSDAALGNVVFKVTAFNKHWFFIMLANLAGALALLLFGMFYINNALQKAAGQKIRTILTSLTSSKIKSLGTGFFITTLNQSSSATILLAVSMVSAGLLSFYQSMGITLGAAIGSTITGQLVAFKLINYALLIMAVGYFVSFFSRGNTKTSQIADAVFGFGVLFYGMKLMTDAMEPVTLNPVFLNYISQMQSFGIVICAGVVITLLMQSSGAVVGMVIALASSRILTLEQAVCLCLGSQIGTCITVLIGSIKATRAARRTTIWQIFHQTASVIIIFPFLSLISYKGEGLWIIFVKWITANVFLASDIARQVAMSHTFAAIISAVIFLPFIKILYRFIMWVYPYKESEIMFGTIYIDENALSDAPKAITLARKETLRIAEFTAEFVKESLNLAKAAHLGDLDKAVFRGAQIDALVRDTVPYLAKIGQQKLNPSQSEEEIKLLYIVADLDEIADVIDRNIVPTARKKLNYNLRFSNEGLEDIGKMHAAVTANVYSVAEALTSGDAELAKKVYDSKQGIRILESELRKKHIARLHADLKESIETSGLHMDMLDQYARINSLTADIGRALSEPL